MLSHPFAEARPAIATMHPDPAQLLASARQTLKEQLGAIAFLQASSRNDHDEEQAQRVDE